MWEGWSGRRDSNPRPSPWQGDALPTEPLPPDDATPGPPPRRWCREPDSNWRHRDFQSRALPTELSRPRLTGVSAPEEPVPPGRSPAGIGRRERRPAPADRHSTAAPERPVNLDQPRPPLRLPPVGEHEHEQ